MSWILAAAAPFSSPVTAIVLFSLAAGAGLIYAGVIVFERWCEHKEKMAVLQHRDCGCRNYDPRFGCSNCDSAEEKHK